MEKGYLAVNMRDQKSYLVTDTTQLSTLLGVHRNTIATWFTNNTNVKIYQHWCIGKGYDHIKSTRGGQGFKKESPEGLILP